MSKRPRHPKPTPEQIAGRALRKTVKVIEDRGWLWGSFGSKEIGFCAVGGIRYAHTQSVSQDTTLTCTVLAVFSKWLMENGYVEWLTDTPEEAQHSAVVMHWNDTSKATSIREKHASAPVDMQEKLAIMRKAADELDPQR
jgi:hypothetical protein